MRKQACKQSNRAQQVWCDASNTNKATAESPPAVNSSSRSLAPSMVYVLKYSNNIHVLDPQSSIKSPLRHHRQRNDATTLLQGKGASRNYVTLRMGGVCVWEGGGGKRSALRGLLFQVCNGSVPNRKSVTQWGGGGGGGGERKSRFSRYVISGRSLTRRCQLWRERWIWFHIDGVELHCRWAAILHVKPRSPKELTRTRKPSALGWELRLKALHREG